MLMNNSYISRCFPNDFTYKDYHYIIIDFLDYIKSTKIVYNNIVTFEEIVMAYVNSLKLNRVKKQSLLDNLLNGGYTLNDLKNIM
jgi:hypothetical protein